MTHMHIEVSGSGKPLVMLHGWAMHGGVWLDFVERLARRYRVFNVDLPGHGLSGAISSFDLTILSESLFEAIKVERFSLLGWSLGGSLALKMAERCPSRVEHVLLLATNPCFLQRDDWPGMSESTFAAFESLLDGDVMPIMTRFLALQVNGLPQGRALLQLFKQSLLSRPLADTETLRQGLQILKEGDLRQTLSDVSLPVHWLLGARDSLVPVSLNDGLLALNPKLDVHVIDRAGHAPFLTHVDRLYEWVVECM